MNWNEMINAVEDAERTERLFNRFVNRLAPLIAKRLKQCNNSTLETMKKELNNYNIRTGQWKS